MPYPYEPPVQNRLVTFRVADVGTAETIYFNPGFSGRVKRATSTIAGAITGSDSTWKLQVNAVDMTNGSATVTVSGSAAGDVDQAIPTGLNVFGPTDHLRFVNAGESTGTQPMVVVIEMEPV